MNQPPQELQLGQGRGQIQVSDIAETVRVLPKMSPGCVVPEIQFLRAGEAL